MTATISFITKILSQLVNDFSLLLTKYYSPHVTTVSIQWGIFADVGRANEWQWTAVNISQIPESTDTIPDMQKTAFPLKAQPFSKRESLIYLFIFVHNAFVNGRAAWSVVWSKQWLVQGSPEGSIWGLFECWCTFGSQTSNLRWMFNNQLPLTLSTKKEWDLITLETKKDLDQIWGFHHLAIFNRAEWSGGVGQKTSEIFTEFENSKGSKIG